MLVADSLIGTDSVMTDGDCCQKCNNVPLCDVWTYCNTDKNDQ